MKLFRAKNQHDGDYRILLLTVALSLFGVVMDFSASYYVAMSKFNDPFSYLKDAAMWAAIGWVLFTICAKINYQVFKIFAIPAIVVGFGLLAAIFTPLGVTYNNATRWIGIGPITIMPGEIMKTCIILFFAWYLSVKPDRIRRPGPLLLCAGIAVLSFGLIFKQPNLSTALIVFALAALMMFMAGLSWGLIGVAAIGGAGGIAGLFILKGAEYMKDRILGFWDPWADSLGDFYQVCQGLLAMGSGGFLGVGLGNSVQKAFYLPEPMNDFILAIIGEELGFVGIFVLMAAYLLLVYFIFNVAVKAKDRFGMLLAGGVGIHLGLQVILNIAVVTASAPPTGVALPLVTLGGNATALFMAELGIVYNISKQTKQSDLQEQV